MNAAESKRRKLSDGVNELDPGDSHQNPNRCSDNEDNDTNEVTDRIGTYPRGSDLECSVLSIQVILDTIMRYLTYKDVYRLSLCSRSLREQAAIEFDRRQYGTATNYLIFRSKNLSSSKTYLDHPSGSGRAVVHMGIEQMQQKLTEAIDRLHFRPRIAFVFAGNVKVQEHQMWSKWFKRRFPSDCTIMNVLAKTAISGSIDEHIYEVHREQKDDNGGLAYLLLGTRRSSYRIQVFKSLKELISLAEDKDKLGGTVKGILYFSRSHSRAQLSKILTLCKQRNGNASIGFGGLVVDSLASFVTDTYTSKIDCAGLVFSATNMDLLVASTVIEEMTDDRIRNSMIRFRDSIPFDIRDTTKNTICFLLSCIEHSPLVNDGDDEYTTSESDIFHTVFPCNVKAIGLSGHGEFGQFSGVTEQQPKVTYQFSCVLLFVQFPLK